MRPRHFRRAALEPQLRDMGAKIAKPSSLRANGKRYNGAESWYAPMTYARKLNAATKLQKKGVRDVEASREFVRHRLANLAAPM